MMMDEVNDVVTDDEIDEMFGGGSTASAPALATPAPAPVANVNGLPVYPLALAQVPPAPVPAGGFLGQRIGPMPLWGWALTALGTGIGGYLWWQSQQKGGVVRNDGEDGEREPVSSESEAPSGGRESWGPSRSGFARQLGHLFARKGIADKMEIFDDADQAKKKLKHVSPLINIKCAVAYKPDKDLDRLCKREGLKVVMHQDGTLGLYPAETGKRGREWEKYIDLLRDDGQTV